MAYKPDYHTTFTPSRVIEPIYTGGPTDLSCDGTLLVACIGEEVSLVDFQSGLIRARIEGDGEPVTAVSLTPDARYLVVCSRSLSVRFFQLSIEDEENIRPQLLRTIKAHSTPVVTCTTDQTSTLLATGGADGSIKIWDIRGGFTTHTFHGHSGVVSALHFFHLNEASSQSSVKSKQRQSGARAVETQSEQDLSIGYRLASGDEDGKVKIWDLHKRKCQTTLDAHVSVVRSIDYAVDARLLFTAGRDKTVSLWDSGTWKSKMVVPVLEELESVGLIASTNVFYTGGERGKVRLWSIENGSEITAEQEAGVETDAILQILSHPGLPFVTSVHADQVLRLHSLRSLQNKRPSQITPLPIIRQISGTHDEIIDMAYVGRNGNMLALATNLEEIRLISLDDQSSAYFGADVASLKGHSDIIITMAMDWSGHWLATGAKDNSAKLWKLDPENDQYDCYSTFSGHAESVSAVALPNSTPSVESAAFSSPLDHPPSFLLTGSSDKTIKKWDITASKTGARARWTRKAHDKDINAIATSFASRSSLCASASQDRTAKIWDVYTGETIGVLRGHKRGVWSAAFSPPSIPVLTTTSEGSASSARGMVLTGSGDKTVRIWSLADFSCIQTFEGHANSILKVVWLPYAQSAKTAVKRHPQAASAAGDGLVKIWDCETGECATTLDNHTDRVWTLAVKPHDAVVEPSTELMDTESEAEEEQSAAPLTLVSGSADSTLTFWVDTTESSAHAATTRVTARVEQDQELQNHIRSANHREAIVLALQLNHPKRLLEVFTSVIDGEHEDGSYTGKLGVDQVLSELADSQLLSLLKRCRDWNANAKTFYVAQHILWALLHLFPKEHLLKLQSRSKSRKNDLVDLDGLVDGTTDMTLKEKKVEKESVKDILDALKAYTDRHDQRLARLGEERFVLTWAIQMMDGMSSTDDIMVNGT